MGMNKNSIFAWASFILFLIGSALILLGVFKYPEYLVELTLAGLGFITIGWAFNALKGESLTNLFSCHFFWINPLIKLTAG